VALVHRGGPLPSPESDHATPPRYVFEYVTSTEMFLSFLKHLRKFKKVYTLMFLKLS
jgi:hypothetical protein